MSISVARKLQALRDLAFPGLNIQVQQVVLTVGQVKDYGLPSTPLRDTERRADRWKAAFGVEQTEIDALAALRPDLLRRLAVEAIRPFFDEHLDRRVRGLKEHHHLLAIRALSERADTETVTELRARAEEFVAGIREKVESLREEMSVALPSTFLDLPEPDAPKPEVTGKPCADVVYASDWPWHEATQRMRDRKAYDKSEE